MRGLILTNLLEKEFDNIKDYVVVNIIPRERKLHPETSNISDDHITFAFMVACTRGFIESGGKI